MIRYIYIASIFLTINLFGQNLNWMKTYGGQGYDEGNSAIQLSDSSYVVVGSTSSFYNSNQNILFLKVDSAGTFIYSTFINNGGWEKGKKIIARNNGEFWICGFTNSMGYGGFDGYLTKVDSLGNKLEDFTYGGSEWDFINDMIMLSDSSLVLVGETQSFGSGNKDAYIVRTDKNGDTLWTKTIGSVKDDWATAVTERNDTLYIVGAIGDDSNDTTYGLFAGLDLNGNLMFENKIAESDYQFFNDIHQYNTNDLYMVGGKRFNGQNFAYTEIGNYQGQYNGGQYWPTPDGDTEFKAITTYPGTPFMMNCSESNASNLSSFYPSKDIYMAKTTPGGFWNYAFIYGFQEDDQANDIIPTNDNGVLVIGANGDIAIGGINTLLIKIGAQDSFPSNALDTILPIHTAIEEYQIEAIDVYPNPVKDVLYLNIKDLSKDNYFIEILSSNGKVIRKEELISNSVYLSDIPQGLYFIRVWSDKKRYQSRIIKQ